MERRSESRLSTEPVYRWASIAQILSTACSIGRFQVPVTLLAGVVADLTVEKVRSSSPTGIAQRREESPLGGLTQQGDLVESPGHRWRHAMDALPPVDTRLSAGHRRGSAVQQRIPGVRTRPQGPLSGRHHRKISPGACRRQTHWCRSRAVQPDTVLRRPTSMTSTLTLDVIRHVPVCPARRR